MNEPALPPHAHISVIGIDASAGGLEAFKTFFDRMPADTGLAFILIPHQGPTDDSLMVGLLARHTKMTVREITDGMPIQANCVYVIPPNHHLAIDDGCMSLSTPSQQHGSPTESQRIIKDGRTLNVALTVTGYRDEEGIPIGIATTERDVSDQLLAEAISHLGEGVVVTADDLDWPGPEILFVNDAMCRITGYARAELIGKSPRILQGADTQADKIEQIRNELSNRQSSLVEIKNYRKDGTPYDAELFTTEMFDAHVQRTNFVSIYRDVSDRKIAERALAAQETLSRAILDSLTSQVAVLDETGRIVRVNREWQNFASASPGDGWRASVGGDQRAAWSHAADAGDEFAARARDGLEQVLAGALPEFRLEYRLPSARETQWYLLSITPISHAGGGAVVAHRAISDVKRAEETLRRDHEFLDHLIRTAQTVVLVLDRDGRIVQFNPYLEKLSGWTLKEVRGRSWFDTLLLEDDRSSIHDLFERALDGERTRGNINAILTKSGERRDIEWFDAPLTDADGDIVGLLCTGQDVTDRIRSELALKSREERLRTILDTAADAIITIDVRGLIQSINPATERLFGYSEAELIGQNVSILMPPPYRDEHDGYIARFVETHEPRIIGIGRELLARRKDGSDFPMDLAVNEVDHLGLFTGIIRDASGRKELQRRILDIAETEQRRIGQELHDGTGQQLTGLGLFAATLLDLLDKSAPSTAHEPSQWRIEGSRMQQIRSIAERLSGGLVEANQHVKRLSHGIMPVLIEPEGLSNALERLAADVDALHTVTCRLNCPTSVRVTNTATATHLYRIVQEAVNNAVRHSQAKLIQITVTHDKGQFVLEVTDNGIGVDERESPAASGSPAPRGFGLEILKHRAGLIGGTVRVTRRDEGGTLVRCVVPIQALQGDS